MPLVLGGASAAAGAFSVDNSCCFNSADSAYLIRTVGTPTDQDKYTFSCWVKRGLISNTTQQVFACEPDGSNRELFFFEAADSLKYSNNAAGAGNQSLVTDQLFRDTAAWYNIVVAYDSAQGVAANRTKLFVNGAQITDFSTEDYVAQDANSSYNTSGSVVGVGVNISVPPSSGAESIFDGYIAEFVFCDGQAYTPSDFGEFDEDSPTIWKPKDVSGLTFGDNGFYLDFEDSSALGNDVSGNNNDFTVTNLAATDQTVDTPSNTWCTWGVSKYDGVFSEGNRIATQTGYYVPFGSFGMMKGKWYWENHLSRSHIMLGMAEIGISQQINPQTGFPFYMIYDNGGATYKYNNAINDLGNASVTSLGNFADGVIVGIAYDADAEKMWASFNGTWYDGGSGTGDPGAGTNELMGSVRPRFGGTIVPACAAGTSSSEIIVSVNFGVPSFTISSGNTDGNDFGNFEYAPPTGFLALCTKNLSTDGG